MDVSSLRNRKILTKEAEQQRLFVSGNDFFIQNPVLVAKKLAAWKIQCQNAAIIQLPGQVNQVFRKRIQEWLGLLLYAVMSHSVQVPDLLC